MNEPENPWAAALAALARLLDREGCDWAVFGGVAANVYRTAARTTSDVDLLVSLTSSSMGRLAEAAQAEGWHVRFLHPEGTMLRLVHPERGAADLVAVEMDYQRQAIKRAHRETVAGDIVAPVLAVEDVVLHKLIAGRLQDDADVAAILEANPEMDQDYLGHWMAEWEVLERLEAIRERTAQTPPSPARHRRGRPPGYSR